MTQWSVDEDKSGGTRGGKVCSSGLGAAPSSSSLVCITSRSSMREGQTLKATSRAAGTHIRQHISNGKKAQKYQREKDKNYKT